MMYPKDSGALDDAGLVQVLEGNVLVRLVRQWGMPAARAWRDSTAAALITSWTALALERRIRLSAIAIGTAIVVHLALTGFSAPEPTAVARGVWITLLAVVALTAWGARAIAAAWIDRTTRRPAGSRR
jgi:hypothetical protein